MAEKGSCCAQSAVGRLQAGIGKRKADGVARDELPCFGCILQLAFAAPGYHGHTSLSSGLSGFNVRKSIFVPLERGCSIGYGWLKYPNVPVLLPPSPSSFPPDEALLLCT